MYDERIEYLKRAIKRAYKRYTGERTDGNATLTDIASFFNIPIDESRLDDYYIESIDFSLPSIKIVDKKNNTTYFSEYTSCSDLLNSYGGPVRFITVTKTSPSKIIEDVYYIGDKTSIMTRMTFSYDGYSLVFEKEIPNNIRLNDNNKFTIQYRINDYRNSGVGSDLLTKTYQTCDNDSIKYTFEQTFSNDNMASLENLDSQNKYAYDDNGTVMYGVLGTEQRTLNNTFAGVCFESTKIPHIEDHFPYTISFKEYPRVNDEDVLSAIIFRGCVGKGNGAVFLQIYKTLKGIFGVYSIRDYHHKDKSQDIVTDEEFQFANLDEGKITSREIHYLLENLKSRFNSDFIELISSDLLEFANRIEIRNGNIEEKVEMLSPKLLATKSIDEIADMIEEDIAGYFKLAGEELDAILHQDKKGYEKKLKPDKLPNGEN